MKTILQFIIFITLFNISNIVGQEIVMAENGLNIRKEPNVKSEIIGKLYCGAKVELIEKTGKLFSIKDVNKKIDGEWVKVKFNNHPILITTTNTDDTGYVFSGYLKNKNTLLTELKKELTKFSNYKEYEIIDDEYPFYIKGDFFGDNISDFAVKVTSLNDKNRVLLIDKGGDKTQLIKAIDKQNPKRELKKLTFSIFKKVNSGDVLWSNYTDDFRGFKDVPNSEKVVLNYDAIYVHESESCGGGFVFWKDNIFNWLQQE